MSYLIPTRKLGEDFNEYVELCRKVARFDRVNKVWIIDEDKVRRLDPDEVSSIAARLGELGVKGVEELLKLSDNIPKIDYSFQGNFLELRFRDEEDYQKGLIFGETQCSYRIRKFNPYTEKFDEEVIRRYWGYRDTLKIRTFRGLFPRAAKFFNLTPKEPYVLIDFDENEIAFLRDYQKDALYHILNQIEDCGCCSLQAATGAGKTEIAIAAYKAIQPEKCFFLSLNTDLLIQAKERFAKYGVEAGLVNKDHFEVDEPVVCCTVQTLYKALDEVEKAGARYNGNGELDEEVLALLEETPVKDKHELVRQYKSADLVIIDECQHVPARTVWTCAISNTNALRLALSATPWRDDGRDLDIYCAMGEPVSRKITSSELIDLGYLVPAEINFIHYRPSWAGYYDRVRGSAQLYMAIKRRLYSDESRNTLIADLAAKAPKPFMCLVKEINHGERLLKAMQAKGLKVMFVYGELNPDQRARIFDMVRAGKLDGIIATTLADEGLDLPALRSLILAGGGKSSTRALQRVGRIVRPYLGKEAGVVYDIADHVRYFKDHAEKREQIYRTEPKWMIKHLWGVEGEEQVQGY